MTKYMTTTEKVFFGAILAAILFVLIAVFSPVGGAFGATGDKPPSPPGQGECEHGNSQKPCKDDPQPDKGKDCEEHGPKEGGVNEDHCKGTVTPPPCTVNCEPVEPPCTQNCEPKEPPCSDCPQPTVPETTTPETTTPVEESKPPAVKPPAVSVPELEEQLEEQAQENGAPSGHQTTSGAAPTGASATSLPYTGLPLGAWVALGLGLVSSGLYLRRRSA